MKRLLLVIGALLAPFVVSITQAQGTAPKSPELYKFAKGFDVASLKLQQATVDLVEDKGQTKLKIDFAAGPNGFPNVQFPCPDGGWDLSAYAGIQITVTNTGTVPTQVGLRVDNEGDRKADPPPWNTNGIKVGAGETETIQVPFGKNYGTPAFPLNAAAVTGIQIFVHNPQSEASDRSIVVSDLKAF